MIALYGVVAGLVVMLAARGARRFQTSALRAVLFWLGGAFGVAFAVLSTAALRIPVQRSSPFRFREELTRYAALGAGVIFLLAVLAAALPIMLDALEGRSFASFVAARHVRATKSGFLTVISVLSMAGVGV